MHHCLVYEQKMFPARYTGGKTVGECDMETMTFEEWAEIWLNNKRNYVKESTYANYLVVMRNHIIPSFQGHKIGEISTRMIQEQIIAWSKCGRIDRGGGLAVKTIKDIVVILKMCLRDFEETHELDVRNRVVKYPANMEKQIVKVWSEEQQNQVMELIRSNLDSETLGYAICLCTGMRIGELCALKWEDVDLTHRLIRVNKTLQRIYLKTTEERGVSKIVITTPKSEKSVRDIPISGQLMELLASQKNQEKAYVLTGKETYIEPRVYREHYHRFVEQFHIEPIKFHALRHTFATRCIEHGADHKVVSELLGHASVNLTLNLYVHPNMEDKRRCVELACEFASI